MCDKVKVKPKLGWMDGWIVWSIFKRVSFLTFNIKDTPQGTDRQVLLLVNYCNLQLQNVIRIQLALLVA